MTVLKILQLQSIYTEMESRPMLPSKEPKGIPYVSELPAPMVLYGEVAMNTTDGNRHPLGSTVYEFETFRTNKRRRRVSF